ncbi:MAG: hypothetical protein EON55_16070 [Alphaproteobacteria bacterium]|nr:MAG: hypothetical protein EON55_16070 [Alphaproteobacteria bacterium]
MTRDQAAGLTCGHGMASTPTFFKLWMPYLYQKVEVSGRKHAYLPLNRDYVPLGYRRANGFVQYEEVASTHAVYFSRDPSLLKDVWWNVRGDSLWLYDDSVASRLDYFERLQRLLTRKMEMVA